MGLLDFLFEFFGLSTGEPKNKWAKPKAKKPVEKKKVELGICVPQHAKKKVKEKKIDSKEEVSPFDKLVKGHENAQIESEVGELMEQESQEPYEYEPELGVETIAPAKEEKKEDELDEAARKMSEGYVPKFSSIARKKLGYGESASLGVEEEKVRRGIGSAEFEVTGVYLGAETMISGIVVKGKITKRMTADLGKVNIRITDLKQRFVPVKELQEGEEGTIFTRAKIGLLKSGTILEFS